MKRPAPKLLLVALGTASLLGPLAITHPASASGSTYPKAPLEWRTARQIDLTDQCVDWKSTTSFPHAAAPQDDLTVMPYDSDSGNGCGLHLRDLGKLDAGSSRVGNTPKRTINLSLRNPRAAGCQNNAEAPGVARCLSGIAIKHVKKVSWGRSRTQVSGAVTMPDGAAFTASYCNGVINPCYIGVLHEYSDIFGQTWQSVTEEAFYWDGTNVTGFVIYPSFGVYSLPSPPWSMDTPSTALGAWPATHVYFSASTTFHCSIPTIVFGDLPCGEYTISDYIDALGNGYANAS